MVDRSTPGIRGVSLADPPAPEPAIAHETLRWLAQRRAAHDFRTTPIPFAELDGWSFDPATGNLGHRSGGFFTIEGLSVETDYGPTPRWGQPIINQNEIGLLGLLTRRVDGERQFLLQAKMEPGNLGVLQLSPTVQATRSNVQRRHGGASPRYLEHFRGSGRVLADSLQSEHGSWFLGKRNRNTVVEITGDVEPHEDFRWFTLDEVHAALALDNVVNMDTRTVLACLTPPGVTGTARLDATLSWLTGRKAHYQRRVERIPLAEVPLWHRDDRAIRHESGRFFSVIAVEVAAASREVPGWTQPMVAPTGPGLIALFVRETDGGTEVLLRAHLEPGLLDLVELAPTVMCQPDDLRDVPADRHPRYLREAQDAPPERIRFDTLLSEEGGRFLHAVSRYLIVDVGDGPGDLPPDFRWLSLPEVDRMLEHPHYLNVQARTLVACLRSLS